MAVFCFSSDALASGVVANADESSLVAAMTGGGAVTFAVNGTIYLTSTIVVSNDTVLDATGYNVAISGSNAVRIFIVNSNTTLALTNLTLRDGLVQSSFNNQFEGGFTTDCGGAISNAGTLQMTGCIFVSNDVVGASETAPLGIDGDGGAVYNTGIVTAWSCVFIENSATGGFGGAVFLPGFDSDGGAGNGGAIFNANQATFINCVFSNNTAIGGVGGDFSLAGGAANGGALCNDGSLVASNSTFVQNSAISAQGGPGYSGDFDELEQGGAGGAGGAAAGGAVSCLTGSSILINDTFWSNSAFGGAGGLRRNGK